MDEKKEIASKRINIKNKKAATKALTKTSAKKETSTKKPVAKKVVKASTNNENEKTEISKNNELSKKVEKESKVTTKKKETKITTSKTKLKKESGKVTKKDTEKKAANKKKPTKKELEKNKLILPKEWKEINKKTKEQEISNDKFSSKIKHSIFEELDEKSFVAKKKEEKEQLKKSIIILLIIVITIALAVFILYNYNDFVKKQLAVYDIYEIGDKVELKDNSIWYVVENSDSKSETVKLLKDTPVDINNDSKLDANDTIKYNSNNLPEYDTTLIDSVGNYLSDNYIFKLQEKVGNIESISLLTSKEFVKIRNKMGFGYEWSEGNWLANSDIGTWWIISKQNEKVYCVTSIGSYKLQSPISPNYVRPTIVIKKSNITTKVEEKTEDEDLSTAILNFFEIKK